MMPSQFRGSLLRRHLPSLSIAPESGLSWEEVSVAQQRQIIAGLIDPLLLGKIIPG